MANKETTSVASAQDVEAVCKYCPQAGSCTFACYYRLAQVWMEEVSMEV